MTAWCVLLQLIQLNENISKAVFLLCLQITITIIKVMHTTFVATGLTGICPCTLAPYLSLSCGMSESDSQQKCVRRCAVNRRAKHREDAPPS